MRDVSLGVCPGSPLNFAMHLAATTTRVRHEHTNKHIGKHHSRGTQPPKRKQPRPTTNATVVQSMLIDSRHRFQKQCNRQANTNKQRHQTQPAGISSTHLVSPTSPCKVFHIDNVNYLRLHLRPPAVCILHKYELVQVVRV
jgi:hypothetical protein